MKKEGKVEDSIQLTANKKRWDRACWMGFGGASPSSKKQYRLVSFSFIAATHPHWKTGNEGENKMAAIYVGFLLCCCLGSLFCPACWRGGTHTCWLSKLSPPTFSRGLFGRNCAQNIWEKKRMRKKKSLKSFQEKKGLVSFVLCHRVSKMSGRIQMMLY